MGKSTNGTNNANFLLNDIKTNTNIQFGYALSIRTGNDPNTEHRPFYFGGTVSTTVRTVGIPVGCPVNRVSRPTVASVLSITSSNANDDLVGTGAQKVLCIGLDINFQPLTEVIDLDGQTPSLGSLEFLRCERMILTQVGTGEENDGDIYVSFSGESYTAGVPQNNIRCAIQANASLASFGMRTVPSGKKQYYTAFDFYTSSTEAKPMALTQHQYILTAGNRIKLTIHELTLSAGIHFQSPSPAGINEKTDFEYTASVGTGSEKITAFLHTALASIGS